MVQKWSRFNGKPDDGAVRHALEEMRESKVLAHRMISDDDAQTVVRWLMEGGRQAPASPASAAAPAR